jgi:hypothetical protein
LAAIMVEIGTSCWAWRASGIAIGTALAAEADGAHRAWFAERPPLITDAADWARIAGPLLGVVPDPSDVADPVVTASAALLVTRTIGVGIAGWHPGPDPSRAVRTLASLADLAPGRLCATLEGRVDVLRAVASAATELPLELAVSGSDPTLAAELGWSWVAPDLAPDVLAKAAGDAGVMGTVGIRLRVVVHADADVARTAAASPLLAPVTGSGDGVVVGDAAALDAAIDRYVECGVERIVLDDLLALGAPHELEGGRAALRAVIRGARLRHRDGVR